MMNGISPNRLSNRKGMGDVEWEQQIGAVLTGLLREVDPLIDPDHIVHLSDMKEEKAAQEGGEA